jgi:hypothetical protein
VALAIYNIIKQLALRVVDQTKSSTQLQNTMDKHVKANMTMWFEQ